MEILSNSSNQTIPPLPPVSPDILLLTLTRIDHVLRYASILIHLTFIGVLILSGAQMRTKNLLYVNHATVVSIGYPILLFGLMFGNTPNFANPTLNLILCTFTGYYRDFVNFIRPLSILIIAIYRYVAVFHFALYKRVNRSRILLVTPIVCVWLLSIALPVLINKSLDTSVLTMLCLNGNSDSRIVSILYFVLIYAALLVPFNIATVVFYVRIMLELKRIKYRVSRLRAPCSPGMTVASLEPTCESAAAGQHQQQQHTTGSSSTTKTTTGLRPIDRRKEKAFAMHFILMCTSVILTTCGFSIFYLNHIVPDYFVALRYWLPVQRIVLSIGVSLVPITSLCFHPAHERVFRWIKENFFHFKCRYL